MEEGWSLGMGFGTLTKGWVEKEPEKVGSNNLPNNAIRALGKRIRTTRLLKESFLRSRRQNLGKTQRSTSRGG
jgi:hypothetical protein